ncbi:MAG: hypothetical protein H6706_24540 [Myxococcales bacterium]|nr:hypothetical protein [Myxococcales bacterium]
MSSFPAPEPHGPIEEVFPGVFVVRGSVRMAPLLRIPRNMVVLRAGEALTVISAVRLSPAGEAALDALGRVEHVVKLGQFHGMDDAWYLQRYGAPYWAWPGATPAGLEVQRRLGVDAFPVPGVVPLAFAETRFPEGVLHHTGVAGGLVIAVDAIQHWTNTEGCSPLGRVVTHAMRFVKPMNVGGPWLKSMTPRGQTLRADFERVLALDFDHAVGGHGSVCQGGARAALATTIERLFGAAGSA